MFLDSAFGLARNILFPDCARRIKIPSSREAPYLLNPLIKKKDARQFCQASALLFSVLADPPKPSPISLDWRRRIKNSNL